jgi:predicted nucleic acid-binding protein
VDASVLGRWLLPGEQECPGAERLSHDLNMRLVTVVAPPVLEHEVLAMAWKAVREGRTSPEGSAEILLRARNLGIIYASGSGTGMDTLELSLGLRQTTYDCSYLALALELGCDLYTADMRFASAVRDAYPCVKSIEDYS